MTTGPRPRREHPTLWMLSGAFAFALMGTLTHALGQHVDWLVVALSRAIFMFVSTAILARAAGVRLVVFHPPTLWMRSFAGCFSLVCNFYAMTKLPVADAITLSNAHPLWIVLATAVLLRRSPETIEWLGVLSGLVGVVLIQQPHLGGDRAAAVVALLSSVSTAIAMFGLNRLRHIDARAVVCHFAGLATLIAGTWSLFRPGTFSPALFAAPTMVMILGVGVFGTVGQYCLTRAYAVGSPTSVAIVGLTQVGFAMGFDVAIWGRSMSPVTLAGFTLLLAPSVWLSIRAARGVEALSQTTESRPHLAQVPVSDRDVTCSVATPQG
jgi:drug/metabolite transporter (DMT)-like permease